jgi:hypothetical protein
MKYIKFRVCCTNIRIQNVQHAGRTRMYLQTELTLYTERRTCGLGVVRYWTGVAIVISLCFVFYHDKYSELFTKIDTADLIK